MASSTFPCSNTNSRHGKHFPFERRPRMLKDFLLDDSSSCSSNGFKSFPKEVCQDSNSIGDLIQFDLISGLEKPNYAQRLQRRRSKSASTTISLFQAMINAVKNIPFMTSVKSPSILPRSLSRKLSKRKPQLDVESKESEIKITVRVKDIMRWKSFPNLVDEKSQPSDFASSPHHCTTTSITNTTTTTGSMSAPCSSNGSSWCDSDFASEYSPFEEYDENEVNVGKKILPCICNGIGKDLMETKTEVAANTAMGPKGRKYASEEKEQCSPLSVLDFEYEEDDEHSFPSFNQRLAIKESLAKLEPVNLQKWMSLEEEEEDEETNEVEEKARELLNHVKETSPLNSYKNISADKLVLDLFREGLTTKWDQTGNAELESDLVRLAKAWIKGEQNETASKWGVGEEREACVGDMEREGMWSKFEEEHEELAWEVESRVMHILVDELFVDFL